MKAPYIEGIANHDDPESCAAVRKDCREALTGARAGWVLSRENGLSQGADAVIPCGRQHLLGRYGKAEPRPCAVADPTHARNLSARDREIRGSLAVCGTAGRMGKVKAASR
jgi:RNA-directed DNA polymerase